MSLFSYGAPPGTSDPTLGVQITYVHTHSLDDEPQYSDDGTEYLYTRRTLRIQGIINKNLVPALLSETPAQTMARVRHQLETPRLQLLFYQNTAADPVPLIQSPPPGSAVDAKQGPFPRKVAISQIQGSECFLVDLEYETYVIECPSGSANYVSHRWREQVTIDERFYTTKTRTGKIVTRSDFYTNPDALRGLITPPIDNGFKRERSEYILQEDGLALLYTFIDKEVFIQPPPPAVKAEGEYIESLAMAGQREAEVRVRLDGSKYDFLGGKGALLNMAITIAQVKLQAAGPFQLTTPEGKWLVSGAVKESLYDNVIEVRFRAKMQPLKARTIGAAIDLRRFGIAPFGSDVATGTPPDPGQRGTANLALIASALNDPCLTQVTLRTAGIGPSTAVLTTGIPVPNIWQTTVLPDSPTLHNASDPTGVYTDYRIYSKFDHDEQVHMLATASPNAPAAFVQLAQGNLRRIDEWRASRIGNWPQIPSPLTNDPNMILLRARNAVRELQTEADGITTRYTITGAYEYGYVDRNKAVLQAGLPPYLDASAVSPTLTVVPGSSVVPNSSIINTQPTSGQNVLTSQGNYPGY